MEIDEKLISENQLLLNPENPALIYQAPSSLRVQIEFTDTGDKDIYGHCYKVTHGDKVQTLYFQDGPIEETGPNGLTTSAMLFILKHRLNLLQENNHSAMREKAIKHLEMSAIILENAPDNN